MAIHLTDAVVKRLPTPTKGNKIYYDDIVTGFGARITEADARAFIFNYRTKTGRERRITIGPFPEWSVMAAREGAKRLRRIVDAGGDPLAEIEDARAAPTISELCDRFLVEHVSKRRPGTIVDYTSIIENHIRPHFGAHMKVADVVFADIDRLHRKISDRGHKHRAIELSPCCRRC